MKKFCLYSKPIRTKRLFPYGNLESSGQVFLKGFIFINSVKEFQILLISSLWEEVLFIALLLFCYCIPALHQ